MTIMGDNPIREPSEDRLGRVPLAESFVRQILQADASEGLVVGVLGPWGSGKTSFANLVRHHLISKSIPVLNFNPWLFSGTEHLVQAFFFELSGYFKFKRSRADISRMIYRYLECLSAAPFVGRSAGLLSWISRLWKRNQSNRSQLEETRDKIRTALEQQDGPVVIILDDLDRLTEGEIRDVFRLVRLTASFPNIIYVLAFDRHQVEKALEQNKVTGREYLEKIVQIVLDLPEVSDEMMIDQLIRSLNESHSDIDGLEQPDPHVWSIVLAHIVMPLMRNIRDIRRYCASSKSAITDLSDKVCLTDILALEAVRLFLPDIFAQLRDAISSVTSPLEPTIEISETSEYHEQQVKDIVMTSSHYRRLVQDLIRHVFPAGGRYIRDVNFPEGTPSEWYQQHRVANTEIFRLYLERVEGKTLGLQRLADRALDIMDDPDKLRNYLESLESKKLRHVIALLETHDGHYQCEHVVPGVTVLLNIWPSVPEHRGSFYEFDNRIVIRRIVLRLLRTLEPYDDVSLAVDAILPELETLSSQLLLIETVARRESPGHELVSERCAERIKVAFRDRVRDADVDVLARERDLLSIFYKVQKDASASEPAPVVDPDPRVTRAMLQSASHEAKIQASGGPFRYQTRLDWDALTEVYGDEAVLRERIVELKAQSPAELDELLELAEKYFEGWRPDWPDDE